MPFDPTMTEVRLRILEGLVRQLQRALRNIAEMARRALENSMAGGGGGGVGGGGVRIYRAIVTTPLTAPANAAANATNTGRATIQVMDPDDGAWATHPDFPEAQVIWNPWPGSTTTATSGKVIMVKFEDGVFILLMENC